MSIQMRRGDYTDFDPTKMVPGEFAVVQENDPDGNDGTAVYMCFTAGEVKRLIVDDDLLNIFATYTLPWENVDDRPSVDPGAGTKSIREGNNGHNYSNGNYSHAEGSYSKSSGDISHCEGQLCESSGACSHAEGSYGSAGGQSSHAEGYSCTSSGDRSHAENDQTTASGIASHSEGWQTAASGRASHAEGYQTVASGDYSHAENDNTVASGRASHAQGRYTVANHAYQHVFGMFNIPDPSSAESTTKGNYVEIVGNGTSNTPGRQSNARTLDWDGNEILAGSITLGGDNGTTLTAALLQTLINGLTFSDPNNDGNIVITAST